MIGSKIIRILTLLVLCWLPLAGACLLGWTVVNDIRIGGRALDAATGDPVPVRLESVQVDWNGSHGRGRTAAGGDQVTIRLPRDFSPDPVEDIIHTYGDRQYPGHYFHKDLTADYPLNAFFNLPLSVFAFKAVTGMIWLIGIFACAALNLTGNSRKLPLPDITERNDRDKDSGKEPDPAGKCALLAGCLAASVLPPLMLFVPACLLILMAIVGLQVLPEGPGSTAFLAAGLLLPAFMLLWHMRRWIRNGLCPPDGIALEPEQAGELHRMVADTAKQAGAFPAIDIHITGQFHLELGYGIARRGLPLPRPVLTVGLPVLQALSGAEFKTVLAVEMRKNRLSSGGLDSYLMLGGRLWRQYWRHSEKRPGNTDRLVRWCQHRFAPCFDRLYPWLSRKRQAEADGFAADLFGKEAAAAAITRHCLSDSAYEAHFWENYYLGSHVYRFPENLPFDLSRSFFRSAVLKRHMAEQLERECFMQTEERNQLSSLSGRLAHLDAIPTVPGLVRTAAANELLGGSETMIRDALNTRWWQKSQDIWEACHGHYNEIAARRAKLDRRYDLDDLSEAEWTEWAELTRILDGWEAYVECLESMLTHFPRNPRANSAAGWQRLQNNDFSGLQMLEIAAEEEPDLAENICLDVIGWLDDRNDPAVVWWRHLLKECGLRRQLNREERSSLLDSDILIEHDLEAQNMKDLIQAIANVPEVEQAFLARKKVTAHPETPLYVLGVNGIKKHHFLRSTDPLQILLEKLDMQFDTFVVPLNSNFKKLQRQFETMDNALIFSRSARSGQIAGESPTP